MFNIRFQGLIAHMTVDQAQVAVLVHHEQHAPILTVSKDDIVGMPTLPPVVGPDEGAPVRCFWLYGDVTVTNTMAGTVQKALAGVPLLSGVVANPGPVRQEIRQRLTHADFFAYVNLRGGILLVEDFFPERATFDGTTEVCVPRTVLFTTEALPGVNPKIDASGASIFGDAEETNGGSITLRPNATVLISNIEFGVIPQPGHFMRYRAVFQSSDGIQVPHPTTACNHSAADTTIRCVTEGNFGVECTNTSFP